jgi:tetratricopeptide (TPR) repeat protein
MFFKVFRHSRIKNALTPLTPLFLLLSATLFFAPFFTASLYANENWQKASELNQKGDRLIAQKRFDEALQAFADAERHWSDSGFYATRQGNVYLWHKKDPAAALQHYDRALTQGGDRSVFTLRERGIAFCQIERYDDSDKAFQSALQLAEQNLAAVPASQTKERYGALDEVLHTLGYASICKRDQQRYTEAVALADRGFALRPNSDNFALNEGKAHSEIWLAHAAFADGRYEEAATHYREAERVTERSTPHRDWLKEFSPRFHRELAEQRLAVERQGIKPEYVHRMHVFFLKKARFDFKDLNGKQVVASDEINADDREKAALFLQVLKRQLEAMSGGRFTIEYDITELDITVTEMSVTTWGGLESRAPILDALPDEAADAYCDAARGVDTIWTFWPGRGSATTANGGALTYPCVPFQLNTSLRGYVSFPANWNTLDATVGYLHEFFHNIEAMSGINPTHGFQDQNRGRFSAWKGTGQMDYFRWHFKNTLPGNRPQPQTYANLNYLHRYPNPASEEVVMANRLAVARIAPEKRREAKAFADQAHELYWNRKQHKAALEAAEKALALNPYQRDALLLAGLAAGDLKKDELAAAYLQRLAPLHPELWVLLRLAYLQQWQLKDLPAAIRTFELIAERHPEDADRYPSYGRALMDTDRLDEALVVFEQGRNSSKEDVAAQSAFWKGYLLGERLNRPSDALLLVQEAYNRGYKDSFVEFFLKKYSGSAVSERALVPEAPVASPKAQRPVEATASPFACSHSGD